jgi:hypothetical protein
MYRRRWRGPPDQRHKAGCIVWIVAVRCPVEARTPKVLRVVNEEPSDTVLIGADNTHVPGLVAQTTRYIVRNDSLGAIREHPSRCLVERQDYGDFVARSRQPSRKCTDNIAKPAGLRVGFGLGGQHHDLHHSRLRRRV